MNETLFTSLAQARAWDVGAPITTTHDHTRNSDGRRLPSSPSPSIRAGSWRCAMPRAPRQLPSLSPPKRANPTVRANSELDKTWGQGHAISGDHPSCRVVSAEPVESCEATVSIGNEKGDQRNHTGRGIHRQILRNCVGSPRGDSEFNPQKWDRAKQRDVVFLKSRSS